MLFGGVREAVGSGGGVVAVDVVSVHLAGAGGAASVEVAGDREEALASHGMHDAGHAAEDEADADEGSERPDGAGRPVGEDEAGEQEGDHTVDEEPDRAG